MRFVGIDPSTKTGLVIIDSQNNIVEACEVTTKVKGDPERFMDISHQVVERLVRGDVICLEDFSYGSKGSAVSIQFGIGWAIRSELIRQNLVYNTVAPTAVKKFATGKGNTKKDEMVLPIYKRWGFEHKSDNVRDAFVIAQIGRALTVDCELTGFQKEVINKIKGEL